MQPPFRKKGTGFSLSPLSTELGKTNNNAGLIPPSPLSPGRKFEKQKVCVAKTIFTDGADPEIKFQSAFPQVTNSETSQHTTRKNTYEAGISF